jgi:hypothetical protein
MKKNPFIILMVLTLIGCDKDSTKIENEDKVRLSVSVINSTSDTKFVAGKKKFYLTIKLYEDSTNEQTGKIESNHIGVNSSGIFVLELDENSYDLFDYYLPDTVLYEEGKYNITLENIENSIKSLTVNLSLNGRTYRLATELPISTVVTNHTYLAKNYAPLENDIFIEWTPTTLPIKIDGAQTVFFKEQTYCAKDIYTFDVPKDIYSHYIFQADMNRGCESMTQEIRDIKTEVSLLQSDSELPSDYLGFDSVSVYFENKYYWLEFTEY